MLGSLKRSESGDHRVGSQSNDVQPTYVLMAIHFREEDRVPERGVARGGAPHSPARAGLVSWRLPEG